MPRHPLSDGGAATAGPFASKSGHALPWWRRTERRFVLSVAKRLQSPFARGMASRVRGFDLFSQRVLSDLDRVRVPVCGAPFRLDVLRRSVSRSVYLGGRGHADVIRMLRENVRPGMTVADVGANVGYMAVHVGDVVGPEGTVLAFEPEPRNYAVLAENARVSRWRNVVPLRMAVGDRVGEATLFVSPTDGGDHRTAECGAGRTKVLVPLTTLDAVARVRRTRIEFVKMDIQGGEGAALRGARATLSRPEMRGLVVEFWPDALRAAGEDPEGVLASILAAGLRCANVPGEPRDAGAVLRAIEPWRWRDLLFLRM